MKINPINLQRYNTAPSFARNCQSSDNDKTQLTKKQKLGIFATSATGVGIASAIIAKKQGFSLNPKVIFSQNPKEWAMLKIYNKNNPQAKLMEIEEKEILMLAGGSATGGIAGGAVFDDKKHMKSKLRETVSQLLGNVAIPVGCVSLTSRLYRKYKAPILSKVPQIDGSGKFVKGFNKILKASPSIGLTAASLGFGIIAGNKFSNFLNEKVFNKKVERGIKTTDFAPHVDDVGMAVTLMADKSALSTFITRTVPAFLCVPGYEIGTHRD